MSRPQSPGYPNFPLEKAVDLVGLVFENDRRNIVDREVAAKHIGYSGLSGASEKALATLAHYNLLQKAGKGQTQVTQTAVDILHPDSEEDRAVALRDAAFSPAIFASISERFADGPPSEGALKSWLKRENFLDRAINPVTKAYLETLRYLEQQKAIESGGVTPVSESEQSSRNGHNRRFGGANLGDLVQWESNGALQFERPLRVRAVSDDGQWIAVEGTDTGIPMSQILVEQAASQTTPPVFPRNEENNVGLTDGEVEWMRNKVGQETDVRLFVKGTMGPKEIGKLIRLLQAQQEVLSDD